MKNTYIATSFLAIVLSFGFAVAPARAAQEIIYGIPHPPIPIPMTSASLTLGSRGADVTNLQIFLESRGLLTFDATTGKGYFGALTKAALAKYQASIGVDATGYFGPMTRAKMAALTDMRPGVMEGGTLMTTDKTIAENALYGSNMTIFAALAQASGIDKTLAGAGPYTLFAPTNDAFAKLPKGSVDEVLKPTREAMRTDVINYQIVAGIYMTKDLTDGLTLKTVEGKTIKVTRVNGKLMLNGSIAIETPDIVSKNGVIHVIDGVLLPKDGGQ